MLQNVYFECLNEKADSDTKTIVLIHGFGGNYKVWKKQIPLLQEHCNVLAIDLPSHHEIDNENIKLSEMQVSLEAIAQKIVEVLDYYKIEKAVFMGVSLGTIFIKYLEAYYPQYVEKGILVGTVATVGLWLGTTVKVFSKIGDKVPFKFVYHILSFVLMPDKDSKKSREVFRTCAEVLNRKEFKLYMQIFEQGFRFSKQFMKTEHQENIFISGTRDHCFLKGALAEAKGSHGNFITMNDCGHVCNIDRKEQFNLLLLNILENEKVQVA